MCLNHRRTSCFQFSVALLSFPCLFSSFLVCSHRFHSFSTCLLKDCSLPISEVTWLQTVLVFDSFSEVDLQSMILIKLLTSLFSTVYPIHMCKKKILFNLILYVHIGCMELEDPCSYWDGVHWWNWGWPGGDCWDDVRWEFYCTSCT